MHSQLSTYAKKRIHPIGHPIVIVCSKVFTIYYSKSFGLIGISHLSILYTPIENIEKRKKRSGRKREMNCGRLVCATRNRRNGYHSMLIRIIHKSYVYILVHKPWMWFSTPIPKLLYCFCHTEPPSCVNRDSCSFSIGFCIIHDAYEAFLSLFTSFMNVVVCFRERNIAKSCVNIEHFWKKKNKSEKLQLNWSQSENSFSAAFRFQWKSRMIAF